MPFAIRRFEDHDHDAVWTLHNLALNAVNAHGGNGAWDDDLHHIPAVYLQAGGEFLVGELNGVIIAIGGLLRDGEASAKVRRMRVHPAHQRQGYGQAILDALLARARELGLSRLWLDTTRGQVAAQRFYEKNGFQQTGTGQYGPYELLYYERTVGAPPNGLMTASESGQARWAAPDGEAQ
jgi:GNAT superfamily N-acetyltransferase